MLGHILSAGSVVCRRAVFICNTNNLIVTYELVAVNIFLYYFETTVFKERIRWSLNPVIKQSLSILLILS